MTITNLKDWTAKLTAQRAALEKSSSESIYLANDLLRDAVAARRANSTEARLPRISAVAHVERALRLAGRGADDLTALEGAIADTLHRFHATRDALHQAEQQIERGTWRITPPVLEDGLVRALAVQSDPATLRAELAEFGLNVYLVLALAYGRVADRAPHLFGTMTVDEETAQAEAATQLVDATLAALRSMPHVLVGLAALYGVQIRPDVDPTGDIFDAALAAAR
jgi:hypothetical protein